MLCHAGARQRDAARDAFMHARRATSARCRVACDVAAAFFQILFFCFATLLSDAARHETTLLCRRHATLLRCAPHYAMRRADDVIFITPPAIVAPRCADALMPPMLFAAFDATMMPALFSLY